MSDELNRMLAEASERIEREASGDYDIPDVRGAAARAGFGDVPETVTVSYVPAGCGSAGEG
ncbi:hypothetical protein Drose_04310 [Dactylosporangium roseum]|uniref:Uncharacterized protein n=1 Tax=Dactylosporangium roseum TaxID=47989 RepID=A0ABY5Z922_9ACTN|nr:hypothetical protein [Dactylosporangium roseum]UWZ37513.1 hypothetical protein Drose_04310 [Dactylosporangium roseum]